MLVDKLPPLPVSFVALQIALNGMAVWFLLPSVLPALRSPLSLGNLLMLMAFSLAVGLYFGNLMYWIATPGVK